MTDDRLPLADGRTVAREMFRALRGRRWQIPLLIVIFAAAAAAGIVPPIALGGIVDALTAGSTDAGLVWMAGAVMAASVVVGAALTAVGVIAAARILESVLADLREKMVDAAFRLPQSRVERAGSAMSSRAPATTSPRSRKPSRASSRRSPGRCSRSSSPSRDSRSSIRATLSRS